MQAEIEIRFLNVDIAGARQKLRAAGAICEYPMRLMKRVIIDYPDRRMQIGGKDFWGWINAADAYMKAYPGIKEGETIGQIPQLTFETMPEWLKARQAA